MYVLTRCSGPTRLYSNNNVYIMVMSLIPSVIFDLRLDHGLLDVIDSDYDQYMLCLLSSLSSRLLFLFNFNVVVNSLLTYHWSCRYSILLRPFHSLISTSSSSSDKQSTLIHSLDVITLQMAIRLESPSLAK